MFNALPRVTALSGVLAALMTFFVIFLAGFYQPEFSHAQSFVSELNESGSLYANTIGYFGFFPIGVVTLFFIVGLKQELAQTKRVFIGCLFLCFSALDWFVTAVFPCDAGCPVTGDISMSQSIHNLTGLFTTILVPVGIFLLMASLKQMKFQPMLMVLSMASILAYIISFILIVGHIFAEYQGVIQRLNILFFYTYLAALSVCVYQKQL